MSRVRNIKQPKPVDLAFDVGGEMIAIVFDKNAMTPNWAQRISQGAANEDMLSVTKGLAEIIISWDLVDEQEQPVPPSAEVLGDLPFDFLIKLQERIAEASVPSSEEGNASSAPLSSPVPVSSVPASNSSPNGATSPSPAPSESLQPT